MSRCILCFLWLQTVAYSQINNPLIGEDLIPKVRSNLSINNTFKIIVQGNDTKLRMKIASIASEAAKGFYKILEEDVASDERNIHLIILDEVLKPKEQQVKLDIKVFEGSGFMISLLVKVS